MDSFEERTKYLLDTATNVEQSNREALSVLINRLIWRRIDSGERGKELVDRSLRLVHKLVAPSSRVAIKPLGGFESEEQNRLKLQQAYYWVVGTIENMGANEMFRLIVRLKAQSQLLIDILRSIPRSNEYVIRTRGGLHYVEIPSSQHLPDT